MRRLPLLLVCMLLGCGGETILQVLPGSPEPVGLSQPLFSASGIPGALFDECTAELSTYCDGIFDSIPAARFTLNRTGDTDENDRYGVLVDPDGDGPMEHWSCYDNTVINPTSTQLIEDGIISNINDGSSGCDVVGLVQAKRGSVVVQRLTETVTLDFEVQVGMGGNAGAMSQVEITREDSDVLTGLLDFIKTPSAQEILNCNLGQPSPEMAMEDCAEVLLTLKPDEDTEFEEIGVEQAAGCANLAQGGLVRVVSELTGNSSDSGTLLTAPGHVQRDTLTFENCSFTGDLGIAEGSTATTITLTGGAVWTQTVVDTPSDSTPATTSLIGNVEIDADLDGDGGTTDDSVWAGGIELNVLSSDDGMGVTDSGGACLGGVLNAQSDDCAADGVFVPASAWLP